MKYLLDILKKEKFNKSYSQCGEDIILNFLLNVLKIKNPTYLDLGANDPIYFNNTYFFYERGYRGVCVEPDPILFEKLKRKRRKDICLNVGVGFNNEPVEADFYIMTANTLSTFSKKEALRYESYGTYKINEIIKIPLIPINDLIEINFNRYPDLISLDIEGLELKVLNSLDLNKFNPTILCIETLTYTEDKTEKKTSKIINFMVSKGYMVYADTYINTIFVNKKRWKNR